MYWQICSYIHLFFLPPPFSSLFPSLLFSSLSPSHRNRECTRHPSNSCRVCVSSDWSPIPYQRQCNNCLYSSSINNSFTRRSTNFLFPRACTEGVRAYGGWWGWRPGNTGDDKYGFSESNFPSSCKRGWLLRGRSGEVARARGQRELWPLCRDVKVVNSNGVIECCHLVPHVAVRRMIHGLRCRSSLCKLARLFTSVISKIR